MLLKVSVFVDSPPSQGNAARNTRKQYRCTELSTMLILIDLFIYLFSSILNKHILWSEKMESGDERILFAVNRFVKLFPSLSSQRMQTLHLYPFTATGSKHILLNYGIIKSFEWAAAADLPSGIIEEFVKEH